MRGALQDLGAMAAPERLLGQHCGTFHRPVFERELHCSAQLRLEHLEARKGLVEQVTQARSSVGASRFEAPHRPEAFLDNR